MEILSALNTKAQKGTTLPTAEEKWRGLPFLLETASGEDEYYVCVKDGNAYKWVRVKGNLTFDETPVAGSDNPVKSGGIYDSLTELENRLLTENEKGYLYRLITPTMPAVDCTELLTMYREDLSLTEAPLINATGCTSLDGVFEGCTNLKTVKYIHMPNVTFMRGMFSGCSSLTSIPAMDTSNVTMMTNMFYGCSSLTSIPELDTSNVTFMKGMFSGCSSLTSIPAMDTSSVTEMTYMFYRCSSLTTIPALDTSNVTEMHSMFVGCSSLTSVTFTGDVVPPYGVFGGTGMFNGTPIASGNGYIFVPYNMVDAYRTAERWSYYKNQIKPIIDPSDWYDTLGFTEYTEEGLLYGELRTNEVELSGQEIKDLTPLWIGFDGKAIDVETGEDVGFEAVGLVVSGLRLPSNPVEGEEGKYELFIDESLLDYLQFDSEGIYELILGAEPEVEDGSIYKLKGYFELRKNNSTGTPLGYYPFDVEVQKTCYLTSAMVGYYGKPDDGVELTAMRRLREVYAEKHAETLRTYYEDSAIIIAEIERLDMEDYYYGRIKDVVDEIVVHVDNENWSVAEGLYLDLYYGLKEELM